MRSTFTRIYERTQLPTVRLRLQLFRRRSAGVCFMSECVGRLPASDVKCVCVRVCVERGRPIE